MFGGNTDLIFVASRSIAYHTINVLMKIVHDDGKKPCYRISSLSRGHTVIFQGPCDRSMNTPMPQQYRDFLIFQ